MIEKNNINNFIISDNIEAIITKIEWNKHAKINIYVQLKVNSSLDQSIAFDFFAVNSLYTVSAKFQTEQLNENLFRLSMNIINLDNNQCFPNGMYSIQVCQNNNILTSCLVSIDILPDIDRYSRNFFNNKHSQLYAVTFFIDDESEYLPFIMHIMNASIKNFDIDQ